MADGIKLKERAHIEVDGFDVNRIRQDFPILSRTVHGKPLIYLDNAATTQKPKQVIEALLDYYTKYNANIHRAVHTLGNEATEAHEEVREKVAGFVNAPSPREIIFTRNATEALNIVAYSLGATLEKGDEIVTTVMEHHSNIVPWQMLAAKGVKLKFVDINEDGTLKVEQYDDLITDRTKIVTVTHASNVLGTINPVKRIGQLARDAGAVFVVDGAQSVPHTPVDVKEIDADFFAFSGHKMLGPTGIGVLYGKKELLEKMQPFLCGGDMISEVYTTHTIFNQIPYKFEAGTPNIADTIAFGAAVDYLNDVGMKNVRRHEKQLTKYALEKLQKISDIKIYGPLNPEIKAGVISFNIGDAHSHDVATILDEEGIAIRSGHNCAMPLTRRLGVNSVCRASFYIYNTMEEIDALINGLEKVKQVLKIR